ncbi:hypothetical protein, partial [Streptomyces sp. NPDC051173]|uniref:hypothetical protein n=1 Tax=Streptomyces sp. NPDC051173 TaxID=3155164 RepID=UPI0034504D0C
TRLGEIREFYPDGPGGGAGFCIDAYNGPISLTMRACGIDPGELRVITAAAMAAAVDALQTMDPDMDADIDVDGAPNADTDGDVNSGGESAPLAVQPTAETTISEPVTEALTPTAPPDRGAATTNTEEEAAMGEPTPTDETTAAPARSLTDADIAALGAIFAGALQENLAPVLAAVTEKASERKQEASETSAPAPVSASKSGKKALKETAAELEAAFDTKLTEALARQRDELREELLRENGLPPRQGYRVHENDQTGGTDQTPDDLYKDRAEILLGAFGRTPQPAQ